MFSTESLKRNLKTTAVRSTAVTYLAQGVNFIATTISTVVLARLLTPDDFGLVALATATAGLVAIFNDLGLSAATVQRTQITHQQVTNLFWINLSAGLFLAGLGFLASPALAAAFEEPRLGPIFKALSALFPLAAVSAQHVAILQRRMQFKTIALRGVVANILAVAVGIIAAYNGYGYWSLVFGTATQRVASAILVWAASPWRPGLPADLSSVRGLLAFGGYLSASSFFGRLSQRADTFIIGGLLGTANLGLFSKAQGLLHLPVKNLNNPLGSTAVPALSAIKDDPERYRTFYRRAISAVASLTTPVVVFSFFYAEEIILIVLGDQWLEAAQLYRYLCPAALAASTNVASGWVYKSWGHVRQQTTATLTAGILTAGAIFLGCQWGVSGAAIALSTQKTLTKIPYLMWCYKGTPIRIGDFFSATWRALAFALLAIVPAYAFSLLMLPLHLAVSTALALVIFISCYFVLINWLNGPYESPLSLIKSVRQRSPPLRSKRNEILSPAHPRR